MFGKFFRKRAFKPSVDPQAVSALQLLDAAIRNIHPDRFIDVLDAQIYTNPTRIMANAFLGRPGEERFFPLKYEQLVLRMHDYGHKNLLKDVLKLAEEDPGMYALIRGIGQEFKLQLMKIPHDQFNLGREVQAPTRTLIDFLNRGATTNSEPVRG